ncbi:MAG: hypothetical protein PHH73_00170 [Candidatus Rickettsiella isopodorum]|nr:hypothetical protein [Candidatus Rickettsiella isopodorum]
MTEYVICDNCPCLNRDIEESVECNLKNNTKSLWIRLSDGKPMDEINDEMRVSKKYDLKYISFNCNLVMIITKDSEIIPLKLKG